MPSPVTEISPPMDHGREPSPQTPRGLTRSSSVEYKMDKGVLSPRSPTSTTKSSSPRTFERQPTTPPKWIILGLWPHAREEQIQYYHRGYTSLYPCAKILVLPDSRPSMTANIDALLNHIIGEKETPSPSLHPDGEQDTLIHLFGDSSATTICTFLKAYRARTTHRLPVKALVLDSVPVLLPPTLHTLRSQPSLGLDFLHVCLLNCLAHVWALLKFWFAEPFARRRVCQDLCDPALLCQDARKCYIWPGRDVMFAWGTGERRDGEGKEGGIVVAERKEFEVRRDWVGKVEERWTGDQERFWLGIEDAWEGR